MKYLLLVYLFITSTLLFAQNQIGNPINGKATTDLSGAAVALNNKGNILAIGALRNDDIDSNAGHVRVFQKVGNSWIQMGQDLYGDTVNAEFGTSLALDAAGNTLVVGAPNHWEVHDEEGQVKVYDWNGSSWVLRGMPILGGAFNANLGFSVDVSYNGNTIIIGTTSDKNPVNNVEEGSFSVYDWNGVSWNLRGTKVFGGNGSSRFGFSISMDSSSNSLVVGEPYHYDSATGNISIGRVRAYEWDGMNWNQKGIQFIGDTIIDLVGFAVEMSANGTTIAIGAPLYYSNGSRNGLVRVYEWSGTSWVQKGGDLFGEADGDFWGGDIAFSSDGNTLATGGSNNNANGNKAGHAQVYEYINSTWSIKGVNINGTDSLDYFGSYVALDSAGNTLAVGAPGNDDSFTDAGQVTVFDYNTLVSLIESKKQNLVTNISPNPFTHDFVVSLKAINSGTLTLLDERGRQVNGFDFTATKQVRMQYEGESGIYFVEIQFEDGTSEAHRIVKL